MTVRGLALAAALGLLASVLPVGGHGNAQSIWDSPEFKEAGAAFAGWDCKAGWAIMWPLAKAGHPGARQFLWTAMVLNLTPPGLDRDTRTRQIMARHNLTLLAYGAIGSGPPGSTAALFSLIRKEIPIHIRELGLGAAGDGVSACYASGADFRSCLDLAFSLGVVPTFEQYAEWVESTEQQTGKGASCYRPH